MTTDPEEHLGDLDPEAVAAVEDGDLEAPLDEPPEDEDPVADAPDDPADGPTEGASSRPSDGS